MTTPAALPPEMQALVNDAYRAGFIAASRWANRADLPADTDSPAYMRERDQWLQKHLEKSQQNPALASAPHPAATLRGAPGANAHTNLRTSPRAETTAQAQHDTTVLLVSPSRTSSSDASCASKSSSYGSDSGASDTSSSGSGGD